MRKGMMISALFLITVACIGWSSDQKEVLESYNDIMENATEENWHAVFRSLSEETKQLLDGIAVIYTEAGVPFNNRGEEFLASLISDTDLLAFSSTVISIDFRNEKAYLLSGQGSQSNSYQFVRENQSWKLNLVPLLNEFLNEMMAGTPGINSDSPMTSEPEYITAGTGVSELAIRNDLADLSIWNIYCSFSNEESWGEDWLGSRVLSSNAEMLIRLDEGVYDIRLVDSEGNTYTLWEVQLNEQGVFWHVTALDRDEPN